MKLKSEYTQVIKKSKFIGLLYELDDVSEVDKILNELKKEHKKARHMPYAYKFGTLAKKSDDKEPSGTAGMPIFMCLEKEHLENTLIVVVRYFGGVKLGAGPLLRAYSSTAYGTVNIKKASEN